RADTLATCGAGRTLLAALALPGGRWQRDRVMALVSDGPVRSANGLAPAGTWERISREAGVVGGVEDWRRKLGAYIATAAAKLDAGNDAVRHDHDAASDLRRFIDALVNSLDEVRSASGWT